MNESLHALSGAYVVDALDDDERAAFEAHLPGCLDCRTEVTSLREAAGVLAHDAAVAPPPHLRASVLAQIATVRPLPPLEPQAPAAPAEEERLAPVVTLRPRRRRLAAGVASLAAAAAVVTGMVLQPWQDDAPPVAQLDLADQVMTAADAQKVTVGFTDGARADVYRSKSKGRAVIVTHKMAAPPEGKAFELWLRDTSGRLLPAGLMTKAGDNKVLLKGDASEATGVGITVEPTGGSKRPTSKPIAMLELDEGTA